jgi:hypothetical protein
LCRCVRGRVVPSDEEGSTSLTIDDLIAREESRGALNAHSHGLDQWNWKLCDRAFTPDVTFTAPGEVIKEISLQGLKARLQENNDRDTARTTSEVTGVTQQTMDKPTMVFPGDLRRHARRRSE